ncbi:Imm27 family immunity protein [Ascidiimonas aurantiaca]|uniref:Imm27 family immunity protein n=1 Tax=Ascidiimonas aurantiaca TaxID=1685432 RepID=UPI0030EC9BA0
MNKDYYYGKEADDKAESLKEIKVDSKNWRTYYLDENTNDKYVMVYLESHLQGGGPPRLIRISDFPFR